MKIELDKSLALPLGPGPAWDLLQDMEGVAACMPGASISERVDDTHYKGVLKVRLGPATMAFKGTLEVADRDEQEHRLRIIGKGADAGGGSAAALDLVAHIAPGEGDDSTLEGRSEITVNGKAAALGGRLMGAASDAVIDQFFENFLARAKAMKEALAGSRAPASSEDVEFRNANRPEGRFLSRRSAEPRLLGREIPQSPEQNGPWRR